MRDSGSGPATARYAVAGLDDLDAVPGPGTLTWRPVRAHFDIRAFGCNAYTAAEPGADVVEPHDEAGDPGHEELYFVHTGRARFTLDGSTFEAAAGTYVFVRDPAVHRHAVALEAGTTVLSFGGPPTFSASGWEWSFRAAPLIGSDPARAREILDEGLMACPGSASVMWSVALLELAEGDADAALVAARETLARVPASQREQARDEMLGDVRMAAIHAAL